MLKFSGYSYLIRGQRSKRWGVFTAGSPPDLPSEMCYCARSAGEPATGLQGLRYSAEMPQRQAAPGNGARLRVEMTLEQACLPEC